MVKTQDVVDFIQQDKNIELFDCQVRFLDNMIHGKMTWVPRGFGVSTLIDGYTKYLDNIYSLRARANNEYDDCITGYDLMRTRLLTRERLINTAHSLNSDAQRNMFENEYVVHYEDFLHE